MSLFDIIVMFLQLLGINVGAYFLIKTILLRRKLKSFFKKVNKIHEDTERKRERNERLITEISERLNLLSRENVKLISKNEELKERLRNLGIKDFDVIN